MCIDRRTTKTSIPIDRTHPWSIILSQTSPGFYLSSVQVFWKHCESIYDYIFYEISVSLWKIIKNYLPFPKQQILDSSKLKEFADDNFKFDKNGRKFSIWLENTVGKGEIARYGQFLLFPQCFQKTCTANMQKPGPVWERVHDGLFSLKSQ